MYFADKDGRYHGSTLKIEETDVEVPYPPRDGRMIWDFKLQAWQETPATLADKDKPPEVSIEQEIAALKAKVAALETAVKIVESKVPIK